MNTSALARLGAFAVIAGIALTGCGGGGSEDASEPPTTMRNPAPDGVIAAHCESSAMLNIAFAGFPDTDGMEPATAKQAIRKFVFGQASLLSALETNAPEEIVGPLGTQVQLTRKVQGTGDPTPLESDSFARADRAIHRYDLEHCGWNRTAVVGMDYKFTGLPATTKPGVTSFEFTNDGKEVHELMIVRRKPGVTASYAEILEMSEPEAKAKVEVVAQAFAAPGDHAYAVTDLASGQYLALCAIPQGWTDVHVAPPDGPPHLALGMHHEFTVKG